MGVLQRQRRRRIHHTRCDSGRHATEPPSDEDDERDRQRVENRGEYAPDQVAVVTIVERELAVCVRDIVSRQFDHSAHRTRGRIITGEPGRYGFIEEKRQRAVDIARAAIVGIERRVLAIEVLRNARWAAKVRRYHAHKALVRVQMLAPVPVHVRRPQRE